MTNTQVSESAEMYLKALAEFGDSETASVGRLAERLGVANVSANEMVRRLDEQGLVKHTPYKGITLTDKGRVVACSVLRRQRLWECFLYDHLKIEWARIYELACDLEHATAPEVTEALASFLGNPLTCPRGNPIPSSDGSYIPLNGIPLSNAPVSEELRILAVNATATDVLKYLQERDVLPGRTIQILEVEPLHGPLTLRVHTTEIAPIQAREVVLGRAVAEFVIVKQAD